eukprot:c28023_g3_i5 orf=435-1343(+)
MAVQSQYPAFILLPDSQYRARLQSGANENRNFIGQGSTVAPITLQDLQLQSAEGNLLPQCNSGLNFGQPVLVSKTVVNEPDDGNLAYKPGKRPRERGTLPTRPRAFIPVVDLQKTSNVASTAISQNGGVISTGLRLSLVDDNRSNPTVVPSLFGQELQSQMIKQNDEISQFIQMEGEQLKQVLEVKRQEHFRTLWATIENGTLKRLMDKEAQLEKVNQRSLELGERVKQLSFESQFWQNMARNSEVMVSNLRSTLEQAVAQSREQSKEGCGESEVDDAESCHYGEKDAAGVHNLAQTFKENK